MTDHYDESGAKARYMAKQRAIEDAAEAAARRTARAMPFVPPAMNWTAHDMREAVERVNELMRQHTGVFTLTIDAKGQLVASATFRI